MVVSSCARSAVDVSVPAEASSSVEAEDTVSMISPMAPSKLFASLFISIVRCWATRFSVSLCSSRSKPSFACIAWMFRNAIPISSSRSMIMRLLKMFCAILAIVRLSCSSGNPTARMVCRPSHPPSSSPRQSTATAPPLTATVNSRWLEPNWATRVMITMKMACTETRVIKRAFNDPVKKVKWSASDRRRTIPAVTVYCCAFLLRSNSYTCSASARWSADSLERTDI